PTRCRKSPSCRRETIPTRWCSRTTASGSSWPRQAARRSGCTTRSRGPRSNRFPRASRPTIPQPRRPTRWRCRRTDASCSSRTPSMSVSRPDIPIGSPIPRSPGLSSPIKHVFYIIRENRTYDQVLGDLPQGNGDNSLTLFGRDVTPNAHALADNFVTFDNFYVDADVSYNGHSYSTAAYSTDFIEKMWQASYARGGSPYLGEGGGFMRTPFGNIAAPPS